jgi:NitT/TauT family transport system substrate-binding protein
VPRFLNKVGAALIVTAALVACVPGMQQAQAVRLRMGVLPILDTLPFYVASQQGYYEAAGIAVELVPVKGAQERDALMQAGEIEGMLTDLVAVALFNRERPQVKVVSVALRADANTAMFRVLSAPGSSLRSARDLAGVPVAISNNTIIEYVTNRLLTADGLSPDQLKVQEVSAIPVRFEQLMAGQLQAATLPEPLASGALAGGANLITDDTRHRQYSQTVLVFSQSTVENHPDAITRFLSAWDRAVTDLNARPAGFSDLLIEKGRVPEAIRGSFTMPSFTRSAVPTQAEWQDVVMWMLEEGLLERELAYDDSVLAIPAKQ